MDEGNWKQFILQGVALGIVKDGSNMERPDLTRIAQEACEGVCDEDCNILDCIEWISVLERAHDNLLRRVNGRDIEAARKAAIERSQRELAGEAEQQSASERESPSC